MIVYFDDDMKSSDIYDELNNLPKDTMLHFTTYELNGHGKWYIFSDYPLMPDTIKKILATHQPD